MRKLLIAALLALPLAAMAAKPTSEQCDLFGTWVGAIAKNRDQGITYPEMVEVFKHIDFVDAKLLNERTSENVVRRLFIAEIHSVYGVDRYVSPEDIKTNRYVTCMGAK